MNAEKTGKLIHDLRIEKGLTQQDLAKALNMTPTAISKWENGHSLPDISMLEPLSDALGVSITEIVLGEISPLMKAENTTAILLTKEKRSTYYRNKSIVAFIIPFITCLAFFSLNLGLVYMTCPTVDPIEDYLVPTIGSFSYPLFMESPVKMAMAYILLHMLSIHTPTK